jgi:cystathionine beta-lyase
MIAGDSNQDEVVVFTPIYPPFLTAPSVAGKKLTAISLIKKDGRYTFDLDLFKKKITSDTKLLLLCSPHNPVGRVFTKEELLAITDICLENNILICSDEVHCELLFDNNRHIPTATLSSEVAQNTITLFSAAKTFNLGGLNCGCTIIPNEKIRKKFIATKINVSSSVNGAGYPATIAALSKCDNWKTSVLQYLAQNRDIVEDFVEDMPCLSMCHIQATYLAWIDARQLGVDDPFKFFEQAGVGLSDGAEFGQRGFVRLNFACSREFLLKALNRMKTAIKKHLQS